MKHKVKVRYYLVQSIDNSLLSEKVQTFLDADWELYGFPVFSPSGWINQAVVKNEVHPA